MCSTALARDLAVGAAAGYVGSRVMDQVTTAVYARTSEEDKRREKAANPEGTGLSVGTAIAGVLGKEGDAAEAYVLAGRFHRGLGLTYGAVAAALVRRGVPPLQAGLVTGAGAFVLVDELALSAVLPPPSAYPAASHLRGVAGHLSLGATVGVLLAVVQRISR
jgi:hypothetical protein